MTINLITPLSDPPSRSDPASFATKADSFLGALPTFGNELNQFATEANELVSEVTDISLAVDAAYSNILALENVVKWVSGTTYAEGVVVFSPINYQNYRRTASSPGSSTTDPSADAVRWKQLTIDASTSLTVGGNAIFGSNVGSATAIIDLGQGRSSDGTARFDLISQVGSDYNLRVERSSGANGASTIFHVGTGLFRIQANDAAPLAFYTNSTDRLRITSGGQVLVGTSASLTGISGSTNLVVAGQGANGAIATASYANDNSPAYFTLAKSRGVGINSQATVSVGDELGRIQFMGSDGTTLVLASAISSYVEGTPSSGNVGAGISFRTRNAANSFAERVRIDKEGNLVKNLTATAPTLANGQMVFTLTSNTNLRISVRGTDGVLRTANITLS